MRKNLIICDCCGELKEYMPFINPLPKDWTHNRESNRDLCPHCSAPFNIKNWEDVLKATES